MSIKVDNIHISHLTTGMSIIIFYQWVVSQKKTFTHEPMAFEPFLEYIEIKTSWNRCHIKNYEFILCFEKRDSPVGPVSLDLTAGAFL